MTITTLPAALKPAVEKAAEAIFNHWQFLCPGDIVPKPPWVPGGNSIMQNTARALAETGLRAFLNAAIEAGEAREAGGFAFKAGMWGAYQREAPVPTDDFPALILRMG
jgi:hypothetical protein